MLFDVYETWLGGDLVKDVDVLKSKLLALNETDAMFLSCPGVRVLGGIRLSTWLLGSGVGFTSVAFGPSLNIPERTPEELAECVFCVRFGAGSSLSFGRDPSDVFLLKNPDIKPC